MSATPPYRPYQIDYFNADSNSDLDAVILDPHGYDGFKGHPDGTEFFEVFEDFLKVCVLTREQLENLCASESDRFAPEISEEIAKKLALNGYRIALVKILLPRELIDANRVEERAIKWLFDHDKNKAWVTNFTNLYQQAITKEEKVLQQLAPHGKLLAVHTMRQFNIKPGYEYMMEPPQDLESVEQWQEYYLRKIKFLESPEMQTQDREHCVLTRLGQEGPEITDPILTQAVIDRFKDKGIKHALNEPYCYEPWIKETNLMRKFKGVSVDFVKEKIAANVEPNPPLYKLTSNTQKIKQIAHSLSEAINNVLTKPKNL